MMYAMEKVLPHTQEVSHILLDLTNLIRGKIPDVFFRIATKAEVSEWGLGIEDWLKESGFQAFAISWFLKA